MDVDVADNEPVETHDDVDPNAVLDDANDDVEDTGNVSFFPPLFDQRRQFVNRVLTAARLPVVADLGCGEGALCSVLVNSTIFRRVIAVDVNVGDVAVAASRTAPTQSDRLHLRERNLDVDLYSGSILDLDDRLRAAQAIACCEVIEHIDSEHTHALTESILGFVHPFLAIFTTPNSDFNVFFSDMNLPETDPQFKRFRHWDHRFEWSRQEFRAWAISAADHYGYYVIFTGIGVLRGRHYDENAGHCTQVALFIRRDGVRENATEIKSSLTTRLQAQEVRIKELYAIDKAAWEADVIEKKAAGTYDPDVDGTEYYAIEGPLLHYQSHDFPVYDMPQKRTHELIELLKHDTERIVYDKFTRYNADQNGKPIPFPKKGEAYVKISEMWESIKVRQQFKRFYNLVLFIFSGECEELFSPSEKLVYQKREPSRHISSYHGTEIISHKEIIDLISDSCFEIRHKHARSKRLMADMKEELQIMKKLDVDEEEEESGDSEKIAFTETIDIPSDNEDDIIEDWYNENDVVTVIDITLRVLFHIKEPAFLTQQWVPDKSWDNQENEMVVEDTDDIPSVTPTTGPEHKKKTEMDAKADGTAVIVINSDSEEERTDDEEEEEDEEEEGEDDEREMDQDNDQRPSFKRMLSTKSDAEENAVKNGLLEKFFEEEDENDTDGEEEAPSKDLLEAGFTASTRVGWRSIKVQEKIDLEARLLKAISVLNNFTDDLPLRTPPELLSFNKKQHDSSPPTKKTQKEEVIKPEVQSQATQLFKDLFPKSESAEKRNEPFGARPTYVKKAYKAPR